MDTARQTLLLNGLPIALFVAGVLTAAQSVSRLGGVMLLCAGLLAMRRCNEMAAAHNRLRETKWRYLIGGGANRARPQLYVLWGLVVAAIGIGVFISG